MSQKGLEVQKNYPLRKKVSEFFWGGWCMQTNWNYERQMNTAFMWGISKTIDRLYPEPEELEKKKERYRSSLEFFNITPQMGSFVLGLTAASVANSLTDGSLLPGGYSPTIMRSLICSNI